MLTRDVILSLRHSSGPLNPAVRRTVRRLRCAQSEYCYRGCRAGRRVQSRVTVCKHQKKSADWLYTEAKTIPTITANRPNISSRVSRSPLRRRVLRRITLSQHDNAACQAVTLPRYQDDFTPSLYLLNAAALTKPHAVQHLASDLHSNDIDIAIISETHFNLYHAKVRISQP